MFNGRSKSLGSEFWKSLSVGCCIFSIFDNSRKTKGQAFQALLLRGYTIPIITANAPGPHMWPSPGPGPDPKCSKTVGGGCTRPVSARSTLTLYRSRDRECSNVEERVSVHWLAQWSQCHAKWRRGGREFLHPALRACCDRPYPPTHCYSP